VSHMTESCTECPDGGVRTIRVEVTRHGTHMIESESVTHMTESYHTHGCVVSRGWRHAYYSC